MTMTDDQLRERIMRDPETAEIAASLGIAVEDYVARVLHYLKNPKADPELTVMGPEDEKANGMPTVRDVVGFFEKIDAGEIDVEPEQRSAFVGFDDDEKSAVTMTGGSSAARRAPQKDPPLPGADTLPGNAVSRGLKKKV
jgi:hypothetical protein